MFWCWVMCMAPPRIRKSGHVVSFELLQADVPQPGEDHMDTVHQWLVAGLRTFQLVILLARGPGEPPAVVRQHERNEAAHELASVLHLATPPSP